MLLYLYTLRTFSLSPIEILIGVIANTLVSFVFMLISKIVPSGTINLLTLSSLCRSQIIYHIILNMYTILYIKRILKPNRKDKKIYHACIYVFMHVFYTDSSVLRIFRLFAVNISSMLKHVPKQSVDSDVFSSWILYFFTLDVLLNTFTSGNLLHFLPVCNRTRIVATIRTSTKFTWISLTIFETVVAIDIQCHVSLNTQGRAR